jgi:hypothetical protein
MQNGILKNDFEIQVPGKGTSLELFLRRTLVLFVFYATVPERGFLRKTGSIECSISYFQTILCIPDQVCSKRTSE